MCACTEPVRTGIGVVCVEYGRLKWLITMLNHTHKHPWYRIMFCFFYFWHPMLVRPVVKRLFFPWKTKEKKARFARAPHYNMLYLYRYTTSEVNEARGGLILAAGRVRSKKKKTRNHGQFMNNTKWRILKKK